MFGSETGKKTRGLPTIIFNRTSPDKTCLTPGGMLHQCWTASGKKLLPKANAKRCHRFKPKSEFIVRLQFSLPGAALADPPGQWDSLIGRVGPVCLVVVRRKVGELVVPLTSGGIPLAGIVRASDENLP